MLQQIVARDDRRDEFVARREFESRVCLQDFQKIEVLHLVLPDEATGAPFPDDGSVEGHVLVDAEVCADVNGVARALAVLVFIAENTYKTDLNERRMGAFP